MFYIKGKKIEKKELHF